MRNISLIRNFSWEIHKSDLFSRVSYRAIVFNVWKSFSCLWQWSLPPQPRLPFRPTHPLLWLVMGRRTPQVEMSTTYCARDSKQTSFAIDLEERRTEASQCRKTTLTDGKEDRGRRRSARQEIDGRDWRQQSKWVAKFVCQGSKTVAIGGEECIIGEQKRMEN